MLETVVIVVHLVVAVALIGFVLIQHGKGADAGASFGSGASATIFGSQGSANFLSRTTAILAAVFFATSLGLAFFAKDRATNAGMVGVPEALQETAPALVVPQVQDEDVPVVPAAQPGASEDVPAAPAAN